ncbi:MAG: 5'-methylthioadenosine/adenosylhomocysteine nucleosidase [Anaerolineales bacterium]|nr:5'-methylthioadenosine/adenosylhomocysteine nucleosidase [Anaerolineales bacterium]
MKIGIVGAMDEELVSIRALAHSLEKIEQGRRVYWSGEIRGHSVFLTRCDPGKVNAALAAQQLIDFFSPEALFNMGSSGALAPELEVGDLVVAADAVQYDFDLTSWGMKAGEILFDVITQKETGQLGFVSRYAFPADKSLAQLTFDSAQAVGLEPIGGRRPVVRQGRVVSGDRFLSDAVKAAELRQTHQALAVDMEAAALAHVCQINKTPFLCVRAISDKADHSANVNFTDFLVAATHNYGKVFDELLKRL